MTWCLSWLEVPFLDVVLFFRPCIHPPYILDLDLILVRYCSSEHRTADWRLRRRFCKPWAAQRLLVPVASYPTLSAYPPSAVDLNDLHNAVDRDMLTPFRAALAPKDRTC